MKSGCGLTLCAGYLDGGIEEVLKLGARIVVEVDADRRRVLVAFRKRSCKRSACDE